MNREDEHLMAGSQEGRECYGDVDQKSVPHSHNIPTSKRQKSRALNPTPETKLPPSRIPKILNKPPVASIISKRFNRDPRVSLISFQKQCVTTNRKSKAMSYEGDDVKRKIHTGNYTGDSRLERVKKRVTDIQTKSVVDSPTSLSTKVRVSKLPSAVRSTLPAQVANASQYRSSRNTLKAKPKKHNLDGIRKLLVEPQSIHDADMQTLKSTVTMNVINTVNKDIDAVTKEAMESLNETEVVIDASDGNSKEFTNEEVVGKTIRGDDVMEYYKYSAPHTKSYVDCKLGGTRSLYKNKTNEMYGSYENCSSQIQTGAQTARHRNQLDEMRESNVGFVTDRCSIPCYLPPNTQPQISVHQFNEQYHKTEDVCWKSLEETPYQQNITDPQFHLQLHQGNQFQHPTELMWLQWMKSQQWPQKSTDFYPVKQIISAGPNDHFRQTIPDANSKMYHHLVSPPPYVAQNFIAMGQKDCNSHHMTTTCMTNTTSSIPTISNEYPTTESNVVTHNTQNEDFFTGIEYEVQPERGLNQLTHEKYPAEPDWRHDEILMKRGYREGGTSYEYDKNFKQNSQSYHHENGTSCDYNQDLEQNNPSCLTDHGYCTIPQGYQPNHSSMIEQAEYVGLTTGLNNTQWPRLDARTALEDEKEKRKPTIEEKTSNGVIPPQQQNLPFSKQNLEILSSRVQAETQRYRYNENQPEPQQQLSPTDEELGFYNEPQPLPQPPIHHNFVPIDTATGLETIRYVVQIELLSLEDLPRFFFDKDTYNFYIKVAHFPTRKNPMEPIFSDPLGPFLSHSSPNGLTCRCDLNYGLIEVPFMEDTELRLIIEQEYDRRRDVVGRISVALPTEFPKNEEDELFQLGSVQLPIEGLGCIRGSLRTSLSVRVNLFIPDPRDFQEPPNSFELLAPPETAKTSTAVQTKSSLLWSMIGTLFGNPLSTNVVTSNNISNRRTINNHYEVNQRQRRRRQTSVRLGKNI